jgi:hypothetical protein
MKSYLNTKDCTLKGSELFGSAKRKLDMPPDVDYDLYRPDKMSHSIRRPNTRVRRACIEEFLVLQSMVWHIPHQCYKLIVFLSIGILQECQPTLPRCWAMQANIETLYNARVRGWQA